ncbi:MAG: hypothetical protein ACTHNS_04110 [Marmoricola sp.]
MSHSERENVTETGVDSPQPPGGPQRGDAPGEASTASPEELTRDLQEQNAETSLDQPSDGSGGE